MTKVIVGKWSAILLILFAVLAAPAVTVAAPKGINTNENAIALHGYDPVAYFIGNGPKKGMPQISVEHGGATYLFASEGNRKKFAETPEKYLPEYGGYCSFGVRMGKKFDIDPKAYKIVDGRLFLQLNQGTQIVWLKNVEQNITIADQIWTSIKDLEVSE